MDKKAFFYLLAGHIGHITGQELNQGFGFQFAQIRSERTHARAQFCHNDIGLGGKSQSAAQVNGYGRDALSATRGSRCRSSWSVYHLAGAR